MTEAKPYRPHNPGHDYYEAGAYLVTLVVSGREPRLSVLNNDTSYPATDLTATGIIVQQEWEKTTTIQSSHGRQVEIIRQVCMPDHWHGVIIVRQRMDKSLGAIIQYVKSAITARWRREITGYVQPPCTATMIRQVFCHRMARLSQLTAEERQRYGYLTRMAPEAEEQYKTRIPYSETQAFRNQGNAHYLSVMAGATVLVTPGISEGEKRIKNMALERGLPLIHLQKEPISTYWKPERQRFEACVGGHLLILAPWAPDTLGDVNGIPSTSDYSQFHNLNRLAEEICQLLPHAYNIL